MPAAPKQPEAEQATEEQKPATLLEALLAVQAEIPNLRLGKNAAGKVQGTNKAGKPFTYDYKYLSLDKLHDEVLPVLTKNGLVWLTRPELEDGKPVLRYALIHAATKEDLGGTFPLMLEKPSSQGLGSALTYARRYALTAVLGLAPDEDDDGAKATEEQTIEAKPKDENRKLNDAEMATLVEAMDGHNSDLLIASVGADNLEGVTVAQGREIFRRLRA